MNNDFKVPPERLDEAIYTLKQVLKEHAEPDADFSPAQEEAPVRVAAGASKTPTGDDVLEKLHQLEARLTALERET